MSEVQAGRFTTTTDDEVTVFLIGMRFNALHRVDLWWPVFTAMPRMLKHLARHPEAGLLGYHLWFGRTTLLLSYWRDAQALQAFAVDGQAPHLGPWRDYMRRIGSSGRVGVWHETYVVPAGNYESVYANMPVFGLGAVAERVAIGRGTNTARQRLGTTRDAG